MSAPNPIPPKVAPLGVEVTAPMVHEVWDAFVKPDQERDLPQSAEMRALMGILRWTHDQLSSGPCEGCQATKESSDA